MVQNVQRNAGPEDAAMKAAQVWFIAASRAIRASGDSLSDHHSESGDWTRISDSVIQRSQGRAAWVKSLKGELEALPEFRALEAELLQHPVFGGQLNVLVGTQSERTIFKPIDVAMQLLPNPNDDMLHVEFAKQWELVSGPFLASSFIYRTLVPIFNLRLEGKEIVLDPETRIASLNDEDLTLLLQVGAVRDDRGLLRNRHPSTDSVAAMQIDSKVPKVVCDWDAPSKHTDVDPDLNQRIAAIQQCMALIGSDYVRFGGRVSYIVDPWGGPNTAHYLGRFTESYWPTRVLTSGEVSELLRMWSTMRDSRFASNKALNLALRRLSYSSERERPEDKLLDLMIACEALYLTDSNAELAFKLAIRAAYWNRLPAWSRDDVFHLYKRAYGIRSKIAHGDSPDSRNLVVRSQSVTFDQFNSSVEEVLRGGLMRALESASKEPNLKFVVKWDALVLTSNPT